MIKGIDDTFMMILKHLWNLLMPIIIIVLIITLIKILIDYKKYGKKVFSLVKKNKNINITKQNLELSIKNLKSYYKLIRIDEKNLILILESGIYVIHLFEYDGLVSGDIDSKTINIREKTRAKKEVINPVYIVKDIINKLKEKVDDNINAYILLKNGCVFSILNRTNIKIISVNAFYYHLSKLNNNKKYDKNKIDEIYEIIVK